MIQTLAPKRKL